jgi:HEPN domain-containing protein
MIRTFDELCSAIAKEMNGMETEEEIRNSAELMRLAELAHAYLDAESNPPEGVIGVGCITYAERVLCDLQQ